MVSSNQPLPARFIPADDPERPFDGALVAWDCWSEVVHHHGAASRGDAPRLEMRAPHHIAGAASPLSHTGYTLDVLGRALSERDLVPDAPMAQLGRRLWERLETSRARIAKLMRQAIIGTAAADWRAVVGDAEIRFWQDGQRWELSRRDRPMLEGAGLATLAAAAFGIPVGVAGVRIYEAATNARLDAHTALEMAALLDRWHAAGAPTRKPPA